MRCYSVGCVLAKRCGIRVAFSGINFLAEHESIRYNAVHYGYSFEGDFSTKAVSFSSAPTTKREFSPRCRIDNEDFSPLQSTPDTQPQLQPALLRLSAMISQYFTSRI